MSERNINPENRKETNAANKLGAELIEILKSIGIHDVKVENGIVIGRSVIGNIYPTTSYLRGIRLSLNADKSAIVIKIDETVSKEHTGSVI